MPRSLMRGGMLRACDGASGAFWSTPASVPAVRRLGSANSAALPAANRAFLAGLAEAETLFQWSKRINHGYSGRKVAVLYWDEVP